MDRLKNLRTPHPDHMPLEKIPKSIGILQKLTSLIIKDSGLDPLLPESTEDLHGLAHLDLSESKIQQIPDSIGPISTANTLKP